MDDRNLKRRMKILFPAVLATGFGLHVASDGAAAAGHHAWAWWAWGHSLAALALALTVATHILRRRVWFRSLKVKAKSSAVRFRRADTLITGTLMAALLVTGIVMVAGVAGGGSRIGLWHYAIGYVWVVSAMPHVYTIKRKKPRNNGR